jgi:DNA polymerase III delta prime subunit
MYKNILPMENYIVSARKYRPSTFDSVVGQRALTTTLKNAIASGKLAHAYLFCGPRGVGKTTCARIFAKTINCLSPAANGEACNQCVLQGIRGAARVLADGDLCLAVTAEMVADPTADTPSMLRGQANVGFTAEAVGSEVFSHNQSPVHI